MLDSSINPALGSAALSLDAKIRPPNPAQNPENIYMLDL